MKRALLFLCVLFFAFPTLVPASTMDGIEMLSQNYLVTATWNATYHDPESPTPNSANYTGGYNVWSAGSPVSASTADPQGYMSAVASIDTFSLYDQSWCSMANGVTFWGGRIQTQAQGVWDFRPSGSSLNLNLNIASFYSYYSDLGAFGGLTVKLLDLTTSSALLSMVNPLSFVGTDGLGYNGQNNYTFDVDSSHTYEFILSGYSDSFDRDYTSLSITASITSAPNPTPPVPDSCTRIECAAEFLVVGLGLQAFRRRVKAL